MDSKSPSRQRLLYFNISLVITFGACFAYWLFGKFGGIRFPCTFALLFHLYCPGCGCTRAAEALLRFDLVGSLVANPSVLLGGITLLYYEVQFILRARRGEEKAPSCLPAVLFGIFFLTFTVLRNVLLVALQFDPLGDHSVFWS